MIELNASIGGAEQNRTEQINANTERGFPADYLADYLAGKKKRLAAPSSFSLPYYYVWQLSPPVKSPWYAVEFTPVFGVSAQGH